MRGAMYFYLQLKRFLRALPGVLFLSVVLLLCILVAFSAVTKEDAADNQKLKIGVVGDTADTYLEIGLMALKNFDSSRFALEVDFMEEDEARRLLESGVLSAYIVIPQDFIIDAYHGDVGKLTYVSTPGAIGMSTIIKDEILEMISVLLVESQKGIYAAGNAADELTDELRYGEVANAASFEYIDFILSRSNMYRLDIMGVSDGLNFVSYVFCGVLIFFLLLLCIGFAPVFARRDSALPRLLSSVRFGAVRQILSEYAAFAFCGAISACIIMVVVYAFADESLIALIGLEGKGTELILCVLFGYLMLSAMQNVIFEAVDGITASVLIQFLLSVGLSYFSGCLYPIYFFPEILQKISVYLPTGALRVLLSNTLTGEDNGRAAAIMVAYLLLFLFLAVLLRSRKIVKASGDAI